MNSSYVQLPLRFGAVGAAIGYVAGNWQKGLLIGAAIGLFDAYMTGQQ